MLDGDVPYRLPQVHKKDRSRVGGLLAAGHPGRYRVCRVEPLGLLRCLLAHLGLADNTVDLRALPWRAQHGALCAALRPATRAYRERLSSTARRSPSGSCPTRGERGASAIGRRDGPCGMRMRMRAVRPP